MKNKTCPICGNTDFLKVFTYNTPPPLETIYASLKNSIYYRETCRCTACHHFIDVHDMNLSFIYSGEYVNATYKDMEGVRRTFERIIALPEEKSDNSRRVSRINTFADEYWGQGVRKSLLDVGSGLGVFPYLMKQHQWHVTALDPDERAVTHVRDYVGIEGICGDFFEITPDKKFDLVTFNKVLEHVDNPIAMLAKSRENLCKNGFVYIEVPDGEIAALHGAEREEFTIDHTHIFSFISLSFLADKAGFFPVSIERLQEPSTKYTLRAFLTVK